MSHVTRERVLAFVLAWRGVQACTSVHRSNVRDAGATVSVYRTAVVILAEKYRKIRNCCGIRGNEYDNPDISHITQPLRGWLAR